MHFFREEIKRILESKKITLHESTEFYVVQLLSSYSKPNQKKSNQIKEEESALALLLAKAMEANSHHERFAGFKALGDKTLFISGVFSDSLKEKIVNLNYYAQMGQHAYQTLAQISSNQTFSDIFNEMAIKFHFLVDTLSELSEGLNMTANDDILQIYERWLHLKSDRLLKKLIKEGVDPFQQAVQKKIH